MLISHPKQFIFVHVYKNAGSSIGRALLPYAYPFHYRLLNPFFRRVGINRFNPIPSEGHASALQIREKVGRSTFAKYFKFAVVRNPWDWQLSLYTYMLKDKDHFQHKLISGFRSFDEYLEWRVSEDLHSQSEYLTDENGTILVDQLLRFETLTRDFEQLADFLKIKVTLPHVNSSKTAGHQSAYSSFGRDLVARHFADDISKFNYSFD